MAATVSSGASNQYSTATAGGSTPSDLFIRDVPDWTDKLTNTQVPLSKMIGSEGAPSTPMLKAEWGWGHVDPYATSIAVAQASTSVEDFTFADGDMLQIGDVVVLGSELIRVKAINGNAVTAERGFASTTPATHLINTVAFILGPAVAENADDADSPYTQGEVDFNYHQIMSFTWTASNRRDKTPTYENKSGGTFNKEQRKKMEYTAPTRLELTFLFGRRSLGNGNGSPSSLGGLAEPSFITTRLNQSSAILTETTLMDAIENLNTLVDPSLAGNAIMTSDFGARIISSWYNDTRRSTMSDSKASVVFNEIETDHGTFKVVRNHLMNTVAKDKLFIANFGDFKKRPYASGTGWQTGKYQTQGWYERGFLRGDFTLLAPLADTRVEIYGFSTSAGDYSGIA